MKKLILLVALLTLVVFVSGAIAGEKPKPAAPPAPPAKPAIEKFSGDIKSVDAAAKSFVVAKGKVENTFVIDDKTEIVRGKDKLAFADLKKGMEVSVEYKKEKDKLIAAKITIAVPKAPPKKEEPKKK